ncbi:MAG: hypothetical protein LBK07_10900 [Tannerella sp.]|nr:hypothetical protein [Tannerella sp.]
MKLLKMTFMLAMSLAFMACANETSVFFAEEDVPQTYTVSLTPSGEVSVSLEPLTKGTPTNDIYGINVYYDKEKDGVTNDIYGYGLFDNLEDMKVSLLSGYKYRFVCSMVKNGKSTLFWGAAFGQTQSGYAYPFHTGIYAATVLGNKFVLGSGSLIGLASGSAHLKGQTSATTANMYTYAPGVERYYGETGDYTPTASGTVSIALKKVIFGAKFVIEGIQGGTLTATCGSLWEKTTTVDDTGTETIYSYPSLYDCWKNESTLPMTVSLSFQGDGGGNILQTTQSVTFKRNTLTVVTIRIPSGTFSITEEPLDTDNYIDLGLNGDGVIDTPVTPTPES